MLLKVTLGCNMPKRKASDLLDSAGDSLVDAANALDVQTLRARYFEDASFQYSPTDAGEGLRPTYAIELVDAETECIDGFSGQRLPL